MLAEIKGKISRMGSNLTDRMEDKLTGDFFGAMRYIPYDDGLKRILLSCVSTNPKAQELIKQSSAGAWADRIELWPYHEKGELDALIEFNNLVIGVEVKYDSALSSDDGVDSAAQPQLDDAKLSRNQLSRECEIVSMKCINGTPGLLLYIAREPSCQAVYDDFMKRGLCTSGVTLVPVSWESIFHEIRAIAYDDPFQEVVRKDIERLLIRRGFERFRKMELGADLCVHFDDFFQFGGSASRLFDFSVVSNDILDGRKYYEHG